MALRDYNALGGTSQSVIESYHQQMADIDRQLFETGQYTGPVPDAKTGIVSEQTLNKQQAKQLKNYLWYEADKLEGYSISDRHQKNPFTAFMAGVARFFRELNPFYQIKKFLVLRHMPKDEPYFHRDVTYDPPVFQTTPKTKEPEIVPSTKPEPQRKTPEQALNTPEPEIIPPAPDIPNAPEPEKPKPESYQEKFYQELESRIADGNLNKADAIVQMIQENPFYVYDVKPEDLTSKAAAFAIRGVAQRKQWDIGQTFVNLAYNAPAIVKVYMKDPDFPEMTDLYKKIPTVVVRNPDTLRYLHQSQMNNKTIEYIQNDLIRNIDDPEQQQQRIQEFTSYISQIDTPCALKLLDAYKQEEPQVIPPEPDFEPAPPEIPTPDKKLNWKEDSYLIPMIQEAVYDHPEYLEFPDEERDEMYIREIIAAQPDVYNYIADNYPENVSIEVSATAIALDPGNIVYAPEEQTVEALVREAINIINSESTDFAHTCYEAMQQYLQTERPNDEALEIAKALSPIAEQRQQIIPPHREFDVPVI